jgi:hypothetical protein
LGDRNGVLSRTEEHLHGFNVQLELRDVWSRDRDDKVGGTWHLIGIIEAVVVLQVVHI